MADFPISSLTAGTPDASSLIEASILTNGSYESYSVTPQAIVDSVVTEITGTLEAGESSITFQNSAIKADSNLEFFTNTFGVVPTNVQTVAGLVTLTFPVQATDIGVKVRII